MCRQHDPGLSLLVLLPAAFASGVVCFRRCIAPGSATASAFAFAAARLLLRLLDVVIDLIGVIVARQDTRQICSEMSGLTLSEHLEEQLFGFLSKPTGVLRRVA